MAKSGFGVVNRQLVNDGRNKYKFATCAGCGLYRQVQSPRMKPYGNFKKQILNIGQSPSAVDDIRGIPWQDRHGRMLQRMYKRLGIDLFEDCLNINSVNCCTKDKNGNNREPSSKEVVNCRKRVFETIEQYQPKLIVLLGSHAIESFLGHRWKKQLGGIAKWRGWAIPDREHQAWVCPVFLPHFVEEQDNAVSKLIWKQDLTKALAKINEPFPEVVDEKECIEFVSVSEARKKLRDLGQTKGQVLVLDYETTGLKPHLPEQKIVCAAIAPRPDYAFAFMTPDHEQLRRAFQPVLTKPGINVVAANMKFEENWTKAKLGFSIGKNWFFDTMLGARILDNRAQISGLKFQTYINFGVVDYDSAVSTYLEGTEKKNGNAINRIFEFVEKYGEKELLTYCGLDVLYEMKLFLKMVSENNLI